MALRERMLMIRLAEKVARNPEYANSLGIEMKLIQIESQTESFEV